MRNFPVAALFILAFWVAGAFADDGDIAVEASNVLRWDDGDEVDTRRAEYDYPDNTIARRFIENRLRLDVYRGNVRVGGRLLYFRPSAEDVYRDGLAEENRVDKRYIEAQVAPMKLRFGHFSDTWGHGLAFSAYEIRDIYFDSELDGAHAELVSEPFAVTALRGTSAQGRLVDKAEVSAVKTRVRVGGQNLGFHYVYIDSGAYPQTHVSSLEWRFERGFVTVYGERAWNESFLALNSVEGHATYLGGVLSKWGWSLLLNYKDYDYRLVTPFQNPALVYREVGPRLLQARVPHVLNITDEVGYQIELAGYLTATTFATAHFSHASRHDRKQGGVPRPTLQEANAPFWETFTSIEQDLPQSRRLFIEIGLNEESAVNWQERQWLWAKFTTPIRGSQELELQHETLLITDHTRGDAEYTDQLYGVGWDTGGGVSLAVQYEISNDQELREREGNGWPSVEAAMSLGQGRHRMALFYGRERGGLRCSNGVCRQVQPFAGWRLTLETTL